MGKFFKLVFSPKGRICRHQFANLLFIISVLIGVVYFVSPISPYFVFMPVLLLPVIVKRLHDLGMTGFYSLIIYQIYALYFMLPLGAEIDILGYLVPVNIFYTLLLWPTGLALFYLVIKKGQYGTNKYGIDPAWSMKPRVPLAEILAWRGIALRVGEKYK